MVRDDAVSRPSAAVLPEPCQTCLSNLDPVCPSNKENAVMDLILAATASLVSLQDDSSHARLNFAFQSVLVDA